jgi:manganese/zinc/iron transport system permease protein
MFGQAALLTNGDLKLMGAVTLFALATVAIFYKELLLTSFDNSYAEVAGFPVRAIHYSLMLLLAFSVVVALQAVGVVLVSAMLITPASAAYMLTDRMHRMLWLSVAFGIFAGVSGAFMSFFFDAPTGPFMVLGATLVFVLAFLFGPRHGVVTRWLRLYSRRAQVQRENTLKAVYHVLEARDFEGEGVSLRELAERRSETEEDASRLSTELTRHHLATLHEEGNQVHLTPEGWQRACEIVRNHRLWELYLTNEAQIAPDHVHDDAEKIEHVLGEEVVRALERTLDHARVDPHGRPIPGLADLQAGLAPEGGPEHILGFGKRL